MTQSLGEKMSTSATDADSDTDTHRVVV